MWQSNRQMAADIMVALLFFCVDVANYLIFGQCAVVDDPQNPPMLGSHGLMNTNQTEAALRILTSIVNPTP